MKERKTFHNYHKNQDLDHQIIIIFWMLYLKNQKLNKKIQKKDKKIKH